MGRSKRLVLLIGALAVLMSASAATGRNAGTLPLNIPVPMRSTPGPCPSGVSAYVCAQRTGVIAVPGLGQLTESYIYVVNVCGGLYKLEDTTARFTVVGKGTIEVALDTSTLCFTSALVADRAFEITGGTGFFAGASGTGTVHHAGAYTSDGGSTGTDTWSGSLIVPGREFDLTPPTIVGAKSRTVRAPKRAKRVRVRYHVSARDEVDGTVLAACKPKSGSKFRIGRTVVRCNATDSSANATSATMTITVRR